VRKLSDQGAIPNEKVFALWARLWHLDKKIHSGVYRLDLPMAPAAVMKRMIPGLGPFHRVTVPEGLNVREIAAVLADAKVGDREKFTAAAASPELLAQLGLADKGIEGYLFPDTYYFPEGMTETEVLAAMVDQFHGAVDPLLAQAKPQLTPHEILTLASMIEKETGNAAERPLVSAVFYNRLKIGLPLQSDPTAVYGLEDAPKIITHKDLKNPSAYNTYRIKGLPPGPICNPGLPALKAALAPAAVPYLFFVSKNDGSHLFSVELAEHNAGVKTYQNGGDKQPAKQGGDKQSAKQRADKRPVKRRAG
jgi:UPF0755 protein